jgi:hypothetical protein
MKIWKPISAMACLVLVGAIILAQGHEQKPLPKQPAESPSVTVAEVAEVGAKVEHAIRKVILAGPPAPSKASPTEARVAIRSEIVAEFYRLFSLAKPQFKYTPRPVRFDSALITISRADPNREALETLIRFGCVGRVGPLCTGTGDGLTPAEFGDALGYLVARISDLTHTPSARWSPYMFNYRDN